MAKVKSVVEEIKYDLVLEHLDVKEIAQKYLVSMDFVQELAQQVERDRVLDQFFGSPCWTEEMMEDF